jgi:UDP-N-acetylmuramate dehydrogenase
MSQPLPNTFGVESEAKDVIVINSEDELENLVVGKGLKRDDILILGDGSNILPSGNIDKTVIQIGMDDMRVVEKGEEVLVTVGAGKNWDKFVRVCAQSGYHGMENLALIPGKVGAAPVQNIGAYGVEQDEFFVSLKGYDLEERKFVEFNGADCKFGYRNSVFKNELKGRIVILSVTYKLSKKFFPVLDYGGVREFMYENYPSGYTAIQFVDSISHIRRNKLPYPDEIGNAGSFFKNPIINKETLKSLESDFPEIRSFAFGDEYKLSAAWLIDQCGWKGFRDGDAGIYEKHALILVNHGGASGKELYSLSEKIISTVKGKFGIELEREVNVLGF